MTSTQVSDRGQITLPARVRKALGIKPRSRVDVQVRGEEAVVRLMKSVREVRGMFREAAKRKPADWETVRTETERLVAEEVVNEDR